jgi:hypothetical protein
LKRLTILFFATLFVLLTAFRSTAKVTAEKESYSPKQFTSLSFQQDIFQVIVGNNYHPDYVTAETSLPTEQSTAENHLQKVFFTFVRINAP